MTTKKLTVKESGEFYNLVENDNLVPCSFTPNIPVGQDQFGRVIMQPSKMCSTQCLHAEYNKDTSLYTLSCGVGLKFIAELEKKLQSPVIQILE